VTFTFTDGTTNCSNTTSAVTVNDLPVVTAPASVCVGSTGILSPTTGGTWVSSNPAIATVDNAGVITGVSAGTVTFTFTDGTTSCNNTTSAVAVNDLPVITVGINPSVCAGLTSADLPYSAPTGTPNQ